MAKGAGNTRSSTSSSPRGLSVPTGSGGSSPSRTYKTSYGQFIFGSGNEVVLVTGTRTFIGQVTSKGIEAQANRFSRMSKSEISDLMDKARKEAIQRNGKKSK